MYSCVKRKHSKSTAACATVALLLHAASRVPAFVQTLAACDNLDVSLLRRRYTVVGRATRRRQP